MKRLILLISLATLAACAPKSSKPRQSEDGGQTGNGGFAYLRTSRALLDESQKALLKSLDRASKVDMELALNSAGVDLSKLRLLIQNMKKDKYTGPSATATNPNGEVEPKVFAIENGQIVAQPRFFEAYASETDAKSFESKFEVRRAIIHEALHEFGIGEDRAAPVSRAIVTDFLGITTASLEASSKISGASVCGDYTIPSCAEVLVSPGIPAIVRVLDPENQPRVSQFNRSQNGTWTASRNNGETLNMTCAAPNGFKLSCKAKQGDLEWLITIGITSVEIKEKTGVTKYSGAFWLSLDQN